MQESPRTPSKRLFDYDGRGDGDYFDHPYLQIDCILDVIEHKDNGENRSLPGIILNKNLPNYESGTGRQFLLIKWTDFP